MSSHRNVSKWNEDDPYAADIAKIARRDRYNRKKVRREVDRAEAYQ